MSAATSFLAISIAFSSLGLHPARNKMDNAKTINFSHSAPIGKDMGKSYHWLCKTSAIIVCSS